MVCAFYNVTMADRSSRFDRPPPQFIATRCPVGLAGDLGLHATTRPTEEKKISSAKPHRPSASRAAVVMRLAGWGEEIGLHSAFTPRFQVVLENRTTK
jgi:hypothetical protein